MHTPFREHILDMELKTELEKADRLIGEAVQALISLKNCLKQVQVLEREAIVANRNDTTLQVTEFYMTRKEAADFIGKSLRQLDRLCAKNTIIREEVDGQIRIRKSELLRYKGYGLEGDAGMSVLEKIHRRYGGYSGNPGKNGSRKG